MIPAAFPDDLDARMALLASTLATAMPTRHRYIDQLDAYSHFPETELAAGVVQLVQDAEQNYSNAISMEARQGTLRVMLLGHIRVADSAARATLAAAERALAKEIKTWCRTGATGLRLRLESIQFSRGASFPYGWLVAYVHAGPQRQNVT